MIIFCLLLLLQMIGLIWLTPWKIPDTYISVCSKNLFSFIAIVVSEQERIIVAAVAVASFLYCCYLHVRICFATTSTYAIGTLPDLKKTTNLILTLKTKTKEEIQILLDKTTETTTDKKIQVNTTRDSSSRTIQHDQERSTTTKRTTTTRIQNNQQPEITEGRNTLHEKDTSLCSRNKSLKQTFSWTRKGRITQLFFTTKYPPVAT